MDPKQKKEIKKKFGKRLTELRVKQKLSFRQLAMLCDVDHSDIKKYEKGEVNPTVTTIVDLATGLNIHPKELLDFEIDFPKRIK